MAKDLGAEIAAIIGNNDEESTVTQFLDTGLPELNHALSSDWSKGLPVGRIVEISGPPSSGKTAIATAAMAAAQKAGGIAAFMDHERSFSLQLAPKLGLDIKTPGRFVFKKPRTFEESITTCVIAATHVREKKLIPEDAPICWVFDSLASMVPKSAMFDAKTGKEKSAEQRNMNDNTALARATSAAFPAFAQHCEELGICAIFLNQIRTKIGVVYGDPRTTPGGDAPKFYASVRIMLGASLIKKAGDPVPLGTEVTASVIKNKIARPFLSAKWRFMFQPDGTGKFDNIRSTIDLLLREDCLEKSGNYVVWDGVKLYPDALSKRIEEAGEFDRLKALLPKKYEPAVVVVAGAEEDEAA